MSDASAVRRKSEPRLRVVASRPARRRRSESKIVSQVRAAFAPGARLAATIGLVFGGSIPIESFHVVHHELPLAEGALWWALLGLVAGGLVFSAKTVWQWAMMAFGDPWKATGFVVLQEGVLLLSSTSWLAYGALALLVGVNAVAAACRLSGG